MNGYFGMVLLHEIRDKIARRLYEYSRHAVDQSIIRDITVAELEQALTGPCELLEDYPEDKYGPSCLILGFTGTGRPIHVHCSYPVRSLIKIITVYEPEQSRWKASRTRRKDRQSE